MPTPGDKAAVVPVPTPAAKPADKDAVAPVPADKVAPVPTPADAVVPGPNTDGAAGWLRRVTMPFAASPGLPSNKLGTSVVISSGRPPAKAPVSVPSALRAITISLLPNWERDVEAAGTISLFVKIPNRAESALFIFKYGYEDPKAPSDRDAYKKWLGDQKVLTVKDDRQLGAAWYIEGTDGSGRPAFRVVVNYGGKKLLCYGSLYKDATSGQLGDLRDHTIIQAKQICETLAL
ncbi:MAG: hypothetical protein M3680_25490 [Myxococcota bacterium]|nr:hypothetical protein [Myxococcota bacterium]